MAARPALFDGFEAKAIQLVDVKTEEVGGVRRHRFVLRPEAMAVLRRFPRILHCLAVVGSARQGKSTLMTMLIKRLLAPYYTAAELDQMTFFEAAPGQQVKTHGLHIFGAPLPLPNGQGHVLLIDCEGADRGNDALVAQLASIACLLSSTLVLHQVGLTNSSFDNLQHFADICDQVAGGNQLAPLLAVVGRDANAQWFMSEPKVRTYSPNGDYVDSLPRPFANDYMAAFNVNFADANVQAGMDSVLERCLGDVPGEPDRNEHRQAVKESFPRRIFQVTLQAEPDEGAALNQYRLLPDSPFTRSYEATLDRLISVSTPKTYGALNPSMEPVLNVLEEYVTHLGGDDDAYSLPIMLVVLHSRQAELLAEECVDRFRASIAAYADETAALDRDIAAAMTNPQAGAGAALTERVQALLRRVRTGTEQARQTTQTQFAETLVARTVKAEVCRQAEDRLRKELLVLAQDVEMGARELLYKAAAVDTEVLRRDVNATQEQNRQNEERIITLRGELTAAQQRQEQARREAAEAAAALRRQEENLQRAREDLRRAKKKKKGCVVM